MNAAVGLWLAIGVVIALFIVRRTVRRNKRRPRVSGPQQTPAQPRHTSERSEMRAYEDPSSLARDITTTGRGSGGSPSQKKR